MINNISRNLLKRGLLQYSNKFNITTFRNFNSNSNLFLTNNFNNYLIKSSFSTIKPENETNETTTTEDININKDGIINSDYDKEILKYIPNPKYLAKEQMKKEKSWHLSLLGFYSKDTISLHNSYRIYEEIAKQASDIEFYKQSNLPVNVRSWFAISVLHIWIVFVRLRKDLKLSKQLQIDLYDRFWEDLEKKIAIAGIKRRFIPKYLKDFYTTYLGTLISYDEGLFDDTVLCNALWRNFYAMNPDVTPQQLLDMIKFIRVQLNHIDNLPDVIEHGEISFHSINDVKKLK
ncbi:hypothetical protein ACTFIZ_004588 [Dictyostelium cf. discoideum]